MRRFLAMLAAGAIAAIAAAPAPGAGTALPRLLRLDGIGPLKLGMRRADALATGWLAGRRGGCPLGGSPPITYRLTGPRAPAGIRGVAEFDGGRLSILSFTRGVRTASGVVVGRTTPTEMVADYRRAGFGASAKFLDTFAGTFVTVTRRGHNLIGGFAPTGHPVTTLSIPVVAVCE
jgi:hypothetical protein